MIVLAHEVSCFFNSSWRALMLDGGIVDYLECTSVGSVEYDALSTHGQARERLYN